MLGGIGCCQRPLQPRPRGMAHDVQKRAHTPVHECARRRPHARARSRSRTHTCARAHARTHACTRQRADGRAQRRRAIGAARPSQAGGARCITAGSCEAAPVNACLGLLTAPAAITRRRRVRASVACAKHAEHDCGYCEVRRVLRVPECVAHARALVRQPQEHVVGTAGPVPKPAHHNGA
jgi:hypothetical protein